MEPNNNFMLVPELTIEKILKTALNFIRTDYNNQVSQYNDEKLSYLYYLTENVGVERMVVFNEAKKIFLIDDPYDPKRININLGWPQTIKSALNVTITQAGEQYAQNAISVDESPDIMEEFVYDANDSNNDETNAWRRTYGRRYSATYRIIVTGDNTNEVLMLYKIFKSLFISFDGTGHLNYMGFENVKITGQDIEIKSDIIKNRWAKALNLSFEYEYRVPDTNRLNYWNGIIFNGILLEK